MKPRHWLIPVLAAWALGASEAGAHFLFVRVGPIAEGGRSAEVTFGAGLGPGEPKFVDKIASTRLWAQTTPGEFRPLDVRKGVDRLTAHLPASGPIAVVGECQYGVIARPGATPFLLRHHPKAVAGAPDELNRMRRREGSPLEIVAEFEGDRVHLVVYTDGKPTPGASIHVLGADMSDSVIVAGPDGRSTRDLPPAGRCLFYAGRERMTPGELDGTHYDKIMEFATLDFTRPLVPTGGDAEAISLFEDAVAARAQWKDFPGFSAEVLGMIDGRPFAGSVTVDAAGNAEAKVDGPAARAWVEGQLASIAMHRIAQEPGDRPVLRFAEEGDSHPLGRLVAFEGGQFASSYRVKDRQIMTVNRPMGKSVMTIVTLDNEKNAEGRFLPLGYVVQHWDDVTGDLRRAESVRSRWARVGAFDLPASVVVANALDGGQSIRGFTLTDHKLMAPAAGAR